MIDDSCTKRSSGPGIFALHQIEGVIFKKKLLFVNKKGASRRAGPGKEILKSKKV
jgi:hypothetical protein